MLTRSAGTLFAVHWAAGSKRQGPLSKTFGACSLVWSRSPFNHALHIHLKFRKHNAAMPFYILGSWWLQIIF